MLKTNLRNIREYLQLTQHAMAEQLEIAPAQYNTYENGTRRPSAKVLNKLVEVFNVNLNYLFTGKGNVLSCINSVTGTEKDQIRIKYIQIPGVSDNILKSPCIEERLQFDKKLVCNRWKKDPEPLRIVNMRGDKMNGGGYPLRNDDILMIDISLTDVSNSGIYVYTTEINKNVEVFISNINDRPNRELRLSYTNPQYESIIYTPEQLEDMKFKVWGRVVKNLSLTLYE